MKKILHVSIRAGDGGFAGSVGFQGVVAAAIDQLGEDFGPEGVVAEDATPGERGGAGFELGLDQEEGQCPRGKNALEHRKGAPQRDEGQVGDAERGGGVEHSRFEGIHVGTFHGMDAGIAEEFFVKLSATHVHGMDMGGAPLEEAVGEASCAGAEVEAKPGRRG
jgi:hypothetical protein